MSNFLLNDLILLFLASNGATLKLELRLPFQHFRQESFSRAYRKLLANGLIEEEKAKEGIRVSLTREGNAYIRQTFPNREIKYDAARGARAKKNRQRAMATCRAVLVGAGIICGGSKKPDLVDLASQNADVRDAAEQKFYQGIDNGFFYSSTEVTQLAEHLNTGNDVFFGARLMGFVVTQKDIFFVYVIGSALIRIILQNESRLVQTAAGCLVSVPVFRDYADALTNYRPLCLIIGAPNRNLPKIFFGTKTGNLEKEKSLSYKAQSRVDRWKDNHATYRCFSNIYSKVFFVTGDQAGINTLTLLQRIGTSDLLGYVRETAKDWGYSQIGDCLELCWNPRTGQLYVLLPYIEMGELLKYKQYLLRNNGAATVIAPAYYKDILSRCLGPAVLKFFDFDTRKEQRIYHYDSNGLPTEKTNRSNLKYYDSAYDI